MNRFVPSEKQGKKARKALDAQRRATWSFSPTIRKVESKKRYSRKTHEREECGIVDFLSLFADQRVFLTQTSK